jgi:glycosyltransferase involved in cell wall biosynthesis
MSDADYLKTKSVICASHVVLGDDEESLFLIGRAERVLVIRHPLKKARQYGRSMDSVGLLYESGELRKRFSFKSPSGPEPVLWLKDTIATFIFAARVSGRFDILLGTDAFTAWLGIWLRRFGKVRRVIYAPTDYIPARFNNTLLNRLYHRIERLCCYRADYIWDVSSATIDRRAAAGIIRERCAPLLVVPNGNHFENIERKPISGINRFQLAYVGALNDSKGVDLIIEAMPAVLTALPEAELVIIGGGAAEEAFKKMAADNGSGRAITFAGHISDQSEIEKILSRSAVGLAPYTPDPDGYINFGDPLKVKQYLACGLPVILTGAPRVAEEVAARQAGLIIDYSAVDLAAAVERILKDPARYAEFRANAISMGSDYSFSAIFDRAFADSTAVLD